MPNAKIPSSVLSDLESLEKSSSIGPLAVQNIIDSIKITNEKLAVDPTQYDEDSSLWDYIRGYIEGTRNGYKLTMNEIERKKAGI